MRRRSPADRPHPERVRRRRALRWATAAGLALALGYWPGMRLLERHRDRQRSADQVKLDEVWAQLGGTIPGLVGKPWADARHRQEIRRTAADIASHSPFREQRYQARLLLGLCSQVEGDADAELQELKRSLEEETHNPAAYELLCRNALRRNDLKGGVQWVRSGFQAMQRLSFEMEGCYALVLERMAANLRQERSPGRSEPLARLLDADRAVGFQEHADPQNNHVLWVYQRLARDYPETGEEGLLRYACYLYRRFAPSLAIKSLAGVLEERRTAEWSARFYALLSGWMILSDSCQQAFEVAERGLRTYVTNEALALNRATALECLDRRQAAAAALAEVVRRSPASDIAWLRAGVAALRIGRYAEAEADAISGLRLGSGARPLLYLRALARMGLQDEEGARRQLAACARLASGKPASLDPAYGLDYGKVCKELPSDPSHAFPRAAPMVVLVPGAEDIPPS
jgi:tetratricopeptide (TPR) repeat protein